jgi:hypothetical protein
MKSLFPDMDKEIADDRKAAKREQVQRARDHLKGRDLNWLVNYLLEKGPQTEHWMMWEAMEEEYQLKDASKRGMDVLLDLYALWLVRKLWRVKVGIHPGSGEESYKYGVRGVHAPNAKLCDASDAFAAAPGSGTGGKAQKDQ